MLNLFIVGDLVPCPLGPDRKLVLDGGIILTWGAMWALSGPASSNLLPWVGLDWLGLDWTGWIGMDWIGSKSLDQGSEGLAWTSRAGHFAKKRAAGPARAQVRHGPSPGYDFANYGFGPKQAHMANQIKITTPFCSKVRSEPYEQGPRR